MTWRPFLIRSLLASTLLCPAVAAWSDLSVHVRALGNLDGAILVARALDGQDGETPAQPSEVVMLQTNRQFEPYILPVPMNVPVAFPNRDDTAHHVYSFSPAGSFELPLYKGDAPAPVVFERPGIVPLGCNIHDWMIGYIYVVDSPWYTQLEDSSASFYGLPEGRYEISLWHPAIDEQSLPVWPVTVTAGQPQVTLDLNRTLADASQPEPPATRFDELPDY